MRTSILIALALGFAGNKLVRALSKLEPTDVLEPLGLSRRRTGPEKFGLLAAGVAFGGVTALLLAPSSGEQTRELLGRKLSTLGDTATKEVRQITGGQKTRHHNGKGKSHARN